MGNSTSCVKRQGKIPDDKIIYKGEDKPDEPGQSIGRAPPNSYTVPTDPTKHSTLTIPSDLPPAPPQADTSKYQLIRALYSYTKRTDDELSFEEGDQMYLIDSTEENWWLASHVNNFNDQGYVPNNYVALADTLESKEWFHGAIPRRESENRLMANGLDRGTFLIRSAETVISGHTHTISVRDFDPKSDRFCVKHYKVKCQEATGIYYVSDRCHFKDLFELVDHFTEECDGLCHKLTSACPKPLPVMEDLSHGLVDHWEIERSALTFGKVLGSGNFGEVYQGKWNKNIDVAIKTLKEGTMKPEKFLEEAQTMKMLSHDKLVKLYAVCTKDDGPIYIVTELVSNGALLSYLRKPQGKQIKLITMIDIITQVASGMEYIESMKHIHRDLAARNILVGDNNVIKIADFGLARQIEDDEYNPKAGAKFPIKWTAPEAINYGQFTIKSDVWAFGIVIYEVVTHGQIPYPGMSNKDVIEMVPNGYRQPKPSYCPQSMYEKMLDCWNRDKDERPTFEHLHSYFDSYFVSVEPSYTEQE